MYSRDLLDSRGQALFGTRKLVLLRSSADSHKSPDKCRQFRIRSTLKTWLISIVINEARQTYRSGWQKRAVPLIAETLTCFEFKISVTRQCYEANER
jgi:hypothetical protein